MKTIIILMMMMSMTLLSSGQYSDINLYLKNQTPQQRKNDMYGFITVGVTGLSSYVLFKTDVLNAGQTLGLVVAGSFISYTFTFDPLPYKKQKKHNSIRLLLSKL